MSDWEDDDFEPEVSTFKRAEPAPEPVKIVDAPPPPQKAAPAAPKTLKAAPTFAMESLGRELTSAEKEAIQKKNDLALARDLFGDDDSAEATDEAKTYANIMSKADFEYWGERVGGFLASRSKASCYGDMIGKLLTSVTDEMTPAEILKMVTFLQQISAAKKTAGKTKAKATTAAKPAAAANKKNAKATLKVTKGNDSMYDDYGDDQDDYDDY